MPSIHGGTEPFKCGICDKKNEKIGGFMFEKNCDNDKGGAMKNLKFKSICILIKSHIQSGITCWLVLYRVTCICKQKLFGMLKENR